MSELREEMQMYESQSVGHQVPHLLSLLFGGAMEATIYFTILGH